MKFNKYLYFKLLLLLFISNIAVGQLILPEQGDEFAIDEGFLPTFPPGTPVPDGFEDISFNWMNTSFGTAFLNAVRIEQAQIDGMNSWYNKQYDLIKNNIQDKLGKTFPSFDEAKNAIFLDSENRNITRYTPLARKRHNSMFAGSDKKAKVNLINLKSLELRKQEIMSGNINNSQYPHVKIGNIYLGDIKSISSLNQYYSSETASVEGNLLYKHNYYHAYQKTFNLGAGFLTALLNEKNNYYGNFSKWERLNLMQLFLNYEFIKKYLTPPYILPFQFQKFGGLDRAGTNFIENYAMENRGGGLSIFTPSYYMHLAYGMSGGSINHQIIEQARIQWFIIKDNAIKDLLSSTSTIDMKIANLIGELEIDNEYQKNWLFAHKGEAEKLANFLNANRVGAVATSEAKSFAKSILEVDRIIDGQFQIKSTGKFPQELDSCCPGGCCPDQSIYGNDPIIKEFGIDPVQSAIDGTFNILVSATELFGSDNWVGSRIRKIMSEIGVQVSSDVENEYLAAVYRIRKRDGILIVETRPGLLRSMLDLGFDTFDMVAFLSPSKGGGAFLAIKGGGKITITKITDHLRKIWVNSAKVDEAINSIKNNAKFDLTGTGQYNVVKGHHPLSKSAFRGDKFYDFQKSFSVSANSLGGQAIHYAITGNQNRLYTAFKKTGEVLTLKKMSEIEIQAMVDAGIPRDIATGWVVKSLESLKQQGVKMLTNIPWNGLN